MRNNKLQQRTTGSEGGFSLVELLVAITIISIGLMWVGQIFATSSQNASFGRTETTAVSLAREIEEKIHSESVDQVLSIFDGVDTDTPGTVTLPCQTWAAHLHEQLPNGRGRIWVRDHTEDPELLVGMFSVQIEVSWKVRGSTMSVPIEFAITSIGG
jgi:prepilin-type N-terminal cleavage/methylation domain-containing protein